MRSYTGMRMRSVGPAAATQNDAREQAYKRLADLGNDTR